jgi:hypothetical protein
MRRFHMAEFIALYRGQTVSDARLVALSAEPRIVHTVCRELLGDPEVTKETVRTNLDCDSRVLRLVPDETG